MKPILLPLLIIFLWNPCSSQSLELENSQAYSKYRTTNNPNGSVLELQNSTSQLSLLEFEFPISINQILGAINFLDSLGAAPGQINYNQKFSNIAGVKDAMNFRVGGSTSMSVGENGTLDMSSGAFCSIEGVWVDNPISLRSLRGKVKSASLLERIKKLQIHYWSTMANPKVKHIGPISKDFNALFQLGGQPESGTAASDLASVGLAAIQELTSQNEVLTSENKKLAKIAADLESRISELEKWIQP